MAARPSHSLAYPSEDGVGGAPWASLRVVLLFSTVLGAACGGGAFQAATLDGGLDADGPSVDGGVVVVDAGNSESSADGAADGGTCTTGEVCAAEAPPGWTGPVQFYYGTSPAPACPLFTTTGFSGGSSLTSPAATCSICSCGGAVTCLTNVSFYGNSGCTGSPCLEAPGVGSTCTTATYSCGIGAYYVKLQGDPSSASCVPSAQSPTLPPTSWADHAQECDPAPTADTCGTGRLCTPTPPAPFKLCIYQSGSGIACPATGPYSVSQVVDTSVSDTRSCTPCGCGLPGGTSCAGGSTGFTQQSTCEPGGLSVPQNCGMESTNSSANFSLSEAIAPSPSSSTCAASGGQPTGAATPTTPITVCCSQ